MTHIGGSDKFLKLVKAIQCCLLRENFSDKVTVFVGYHPRAQTTENWFMSNNVLPLRYSPKPVAFHPDTLLLVVTLKALKTKHVQEYSQAPIKIRLQTSAAL